MNSRWPGSRLAGAGARAAARRRRRAPAGMYAATPRMLLLSALASSTPRASRARGAGRRCRGGGRCMWCLPGMRAGGRRLALRSLHQRAGAAGAAAGASSFALLSVQESRRRTDPCVTDPACGVAERHPTSTDLLAAAYSKCVRAPASGHAGLSSIPLFFCCQPASLRALPAAAAGAACYARYYCRRSPDHACYRAPALLADAPIVISGPCSQQAPARQRRRSGRRMKKAWQTAAAGAATQQQSQASASSPDAPPLLPHHLLRRPCRRLLVAPGWWLLATQLTQRAHQPGDKTKTRS